MDTIMIQDTTRIQGKLQEKIDSYSGMLFKIAYARMGNRADAEDIVQETFYQYFKASREFEDEEYEKAWLIRVALNGCNKMWRSSFHRRRSEVPDPEQIFAGRIRRQRIVARRRRFWTRRRPGQCWKQCGSCPSHTGM